MVRNSVFALALLSSVLVFGAVAPSAHADGPKFVVGQTVLADATMCDTSASVQKLVELIYTLADGTPLPSVLAIAPTMGINCLHGRWPLTYQGNPTPFQVQGVDYLALHFKNGAVDCYSWIRASRPPEELSPGEKAA